MGDLIEFLVGVVTRIWRTDSEMRDDSIFGESEMERKDRKSVAWVCGGAIVLLVIAGFTCWWFIKIK